MNRNKHFVKGLGCYLVRKGRLMNVNDLVLLLNRRGYKTSYGTDYIVGARGIYTLLRATYNSLVNLGLMAEAKSVADAFVGPNGYPVWYD